MATEWANLKKHKNCNQKEEKCGKTRVLDEFHTFCVQFTTSKQIILQTFAPRNNKLTKTTTTIKANQKKTGAQAPPKWSDGKILEEMMNGIGSK